MNLSQPKINDKNTLTRIQASNHRSHKDAQALWCTVASRVGSLGTSFNPMASSMLFRSSGGRQELPLFTEFLSRSGIYPISGIKLWPTKLT
jgi:hypothetical protein